MIALMIPYDFDRFKTDIQLLGRRCEPFHPDTIVGIARGGVTLAHALCVYFDLRNLQTIRCESYDGQSQRTTLSVSGKCDFSTSKRVLIVDDIVDSGKTLSAILPMFRQEYPHLEFKSAALFTKSPAQIQPDFSLHEATDWIDFFWERDYIKGELKSNLL